MKLLLLSLALLLASGAQASRYPMGNRHALQKAGLVMVRAHVTQETHQRWDASSTAYYRLSIAEIISPANLKLSKEFLQEVTVVDKYDRSTGMISLEQNEHAVLFLEKVDEDYVSRREMNPDTPEGQQSLSALRTFLQLMKIALPEERAEACLAAWPQAQSSFAKNAVLDAMFEIHSSRCAPLLLKVALSQDSKYVRSWAITILTQVGNYDQIKQLIPVLEDPNDLRRQVLIAFGWQRTREAAKRIERLVTENLESLPESLGQDLRSRAQATLSQIKGEKTKPEETYPCPSQRNRRRSVSASVLHLPHFLELPNFALTQLEPLPIAPR